MDRFLFVFLQSCFVITLYSQSINNANINTINGQYIIHVETSTDVPTLFKKWNANIRNSQSYPILSQIMDEPLNLWLVTYPENSSNESFVALNWQREIKSVVKNKNIIQRLIPNDPLLTNQWQYQNTEANTFGNDMDMLRAWDITTGGITPSGDTIVICVIDDGVNANHEDLVGNIWYNHNETPNNGIDDDQNGYVDDYKGWNVKSQNDDVFTGGGHGTPVVGIVGAKGNNGIGVTGVNWNIKIMMVNYGSSTEANALSAYAYAYKMRKQYNESNGAKGAYIVATNASWGIDKTKAEEAPLWCALYDSLGQVGILNCGATANSNVDVDIEGDLPTSCESEYLISVTNLNKNDVKIGSAGYGRKSIDIGAYGQSAYTLTRTAYGTFGGTSGATPHVTGMIGLLYSINCRIFDSLSHINPAASALIAKDMLLSGALKLPSLKGITTTGGKLNAFRAASNLLTLCKDCSPPSGIVLKANDESLIVSWHAGTEHLIDLRYRKFDDLNWTLINNFSNGDTIPNLTHCTEYEIQVGSTCGYLNDQFTYSKFFETSGCCTKPDIQSLDGTESTVQINWTSTLPAFYYLQYKEGQSEWQDTFIQGNSFKLSDLASCTAYQFRVKSECVTYGDVSDYTNVYNISTACGNCTEIDYCTFGSKDVSDEWIESFTLAGETFESGPSERGYKDFAGLTNFELQAGSTNIFKILAGYGSSSFKDFYKILIDLNQDGIWSENELIFDTPEGERDSVIGEISIPLDAMEGYTKMRVIISYEQFSNGCDDIVFEYGEVEDYCVYIVSESCSNDAKTQVKTIQNNSLTFKISYNDDRKEDIKLSLRPYGSNEWKSIIGRDSIVFNGLEKCTLHEYQFYGYCGNLVSPPSAIDTISTSCLNSVFDINNFFTISPNPTSGALNITSSVKQLNNVTMVVKDAAGRKIFSKEFSGSTLNFDITDLISGFYILELHENTGQKFSIKIIKI